MDDFEKLKEYKLHNVPVPTYAELQELKSKRDKLAYDLGVADTKNGELLRLLKECKTKIDELLDIYIGFDEDYCFEHGNKWNENYFKKENGRFYELLAKIDEELL